MSTMAITWTDEDKNRLARREVIIHQQNITEPDLDQKNLPTDIHLVEYRQNNNIYSDAVRASKMSEIFDAYYDRLKESGGGEILSIRSGFGTIKPKLYNYSSEKKKG